MASSEENLVTDAEDKATGTKEYCTNCNTLLIGDYCHVCGQKNIGPKLNSRLMLHNLFEAITDLNSRPWHTVIALLKNPGAVAYEYVEGARSSFINPIRYVVTTFAIYVGFLAANGWLAVAFAANVEASGGPELDPNTREMATQFLTELRNVVSEKRDIMTFLVIPIFSFLLRWLFFKTERNFAETLTFSCYVIGQYNLYSFFVALFAFAVPSVDYAGTPLPILPIVMFISVAGFYKRGWFKTLLMGIVAFILFFALQWGVAFGLAYTAVQFS